MVSYLMLKSVDIMEELGVTGLNETEKAVLDEIKEGEVSTSTLSKNVEIVGNCPDELMRILNKLRRKGLVEGHYSNQSGEWVWSKKVKSK